jgi:hypothetical protein
MEGEVSESAAVVHEVEAPSRTEEVPADAEEKTAPVLQGVEQRPIAWRGEDLELRAYRWGERVPHPSLLRAVEALNDVSPFLLSGEMEDTHQRRAGREKDTNMADGSTAKE